MATSSARVARRRTFLAVVVVLCALLGGCGRMEESLRADYERVADVPAPSGFTDAGIPLSEASGPRVVIQTDLTCPACQEFFSRHGAEIGALVEAGTAQVSLAVLEVRSRSALNTMALEIYYAVADAHPQEALDSYLAVSSAVQGLPDDTDRATARQRILDRLPPHVRPAAEDPPPLSGQTADWILARTLENRLGAGVVPAVVVDGEPSVGPQLADVLTRLAPP
jgi:hypothetical protein